jgi:hypothetical protein
VLPKFRVVRRDARFQLVDGILSLAYAPLRIIQRPGDAFASLVPFLRFSLDLCCASRKL